MLATALLIVASFASNPGESMDQFVVRTAKSAISSTRQSGNEVCGALVKDGDNLSITYVTTGSTRSCLIPATEGSVSTVHTHPGTSTVLKFSATDYQNAGYLITETGIAYQTGTRESVRVVARGKSGMYRIVNSP